MLVEVFFVDILDSAQEAFPHMWVNGEKYVFSEHVIQKGVTLFQTFKQLISCLASVQTK